MANYSTDTKRKLAVSLPVAKMLSATVREEIFIYAFGIQTLLIRAEDKSFVNDLFTKARNRSEQFMATLN